MLDLSRIRDLWRDLGPRGQLTIVVSSLLVLVTVFLVYRYSSRPSYSRLASGLDPGQAARVAKALEATGIPYRLTAGGTAVSVKEGDLAAARLAVAEKGALPGSHVGFELFDKKSLAASDFQQRVNYQRALEGEIARTIEQIDGVQAAQVQLVLPEDSIFLDEQSKASAAVLLSGSGIDAGSVRAIAQLVAASVKGLDPSRVTITDSSGALLWPGSRAGSPDALAKLEAEQAYAAQLSSQINAFLASTVGAGKAQVRVHADLSLDSKEIAKVTYAGKGVPLQSQTETETLGSKGAAASPAPAGVAGNVPSYAGSVPAGGQSSYDRKTETTTYGVGKTVERTTVAPGTVRRLDVALLVDRSLPQAQVASLRSAVASMAGVDASRGDTLSVSPVDFVEPPAPPKAGGPFALLAKVSGAAKTAGLALAALAFLALLVRGLRRREQDAVAPEPTWLREIEASWPLRELEAPTTRIEVDPEAQKRAALRGELEEIVRTQPEHVAMQVSQWMRE